MTAPRIPVTWPEGFAPPDPARTDAEDVLRGMIDVFPSVPAGETSHKFTIEAAGYQLAYRIIGGPQPSIAVEKVEPPLD